MFQLGHRRGQQLGGVDPAVQDLPLAGVRPSVVGDAGTSQVHHGVHALERLRRQLAGRRIPRHLVLGRRPPHQRHDPMTGRSQVVDQRGADQPTRPGNHDLEGSSAHRNLRQSLVLNATAVLGQVERDVDDHVLLAADHPAPAELDQDVRVSTP